VGHVQWVATEDAWRSKGLGRRVMQGIVDWLRERDIAAVELYASDDGVALYRSMGFDTPLRPYLRLAIV
jgi:GNAT superfamily N-acetyltransferase